MCAHRHQCNTLYSYIFDVSHFFPSQQQLSCCTSHAVSYVRFQQEVFHTVAATLPPDTLASVVVKSVAKIWHEMSDIQKQPYRAAYLADKAKQQQLSGNPLPVAKLKPTMKVCARSGPGLAVHSRKSYLKHCEVRRVC